MVARPAPHTEAFMLAQMRNLTRNWFARILLGVIALAMAITLFQGDFLSGLTGMFNPNGVARVGSETVTDRMMQREFELFLRSAQRENQSVTRQAAIEQGLPARVMEIIIQRRALQRYAEKLGVRASAGQLSDAIRTLPNTQNQVTGNFDRTAYESFLREIGYSTGEFEQEMRGDLATSMLMQALSAGTRPPSSYGAMLLAFQSERRTASVAQAETARLLGDLPDPSVAQLRDLYEDSRAAFAVPEYRAVTIVHARVLDFAARASVPESRLREEFEARKAGFGSPERRSFVQLTARNEAQAQDAVRRMAAGESPEAVAAALSLEVVRQDDRLATDIADTGVRAAVFAMPADAPPRAVRAQLSPWAAVKLTSVTPAVEASFELAREQLLEEISQAEGATAMEAAITAFETARDEGAPLAQAARANGLAVTIVPAVDAQGRTPDGSPAEAFIDQADLVQAVFQTQEGEATDFMPLLEGVDVILGVDKITPATTRPFEDVQDALRARWLARERARRLNEIGEQVKAAVAGGKTFAEAVAAARLPLLIRSQPLDRQAAARLPDTQLAQLIFAGPAGEVRFGVRGEADALVVAFVESIERADPATNPQEVESLRRQMQTQVGQGLVAAIEASAVAGTRVTRNARRMEALFGAGDADDGSKGP
jgi:peptidyl-prolyl cis-trans isomerase D